MRAVEGAGPRTGGSDRPRRRDRARLDPDDPDGNRFVDLAGELRGRDHRPCPPGGRRRGPRPGRRASHVSSASVSEPRVAFEEALVGDRAAGLDRVLLGMSGSDANDTALKLAGR
jgi:4-aminobutyrate aminotransferase-like enzyme